MELEHVRGNTWVLRSWELIPLYKLDERHIVLLDTGLTNQRAELEETLAKAGLEVVGIIGSHAHIDHMGSYAYYQQKGAQLALSLGEAGQLFSYHAFHLQYHNLSIEQFSQYEEIAGTPCLADRIVLPHEDKISFCGADFDILHTPGHTADHICVRTPDNVLYLADAMMSGKTLFYSKFPYAFCVKTYLETLGKLRSEQADRYIVAHYGIYNEILPYIDLELRYITRRMDELLELVEDYTTPKRMAQAICKHYRVRAGNIRKMAYFEQSAQTFLHYLCETGDLEAVMEDSRILYRRTPASRQKQRKREISLPHQAELF